MHEDPEGVGVTDIINKMSGAAAISEKGAGTVRKKAEVRRGRSGNNDTVTISEEARRLGSTEESDRRPDDKDS